MQLSIMEKKITNTMVSGLKIDSKNLEKVRTLLLLGKWINLRLKHLRKGMRTRCNSWTFNFRLQKVNICRVIISKKSTRTALV